MKIYIILIFLLVLLLAVRVFIFLRHVPRYQAGQSLDIEYTFLSNPSLKYGKQIFNIHGIVVYIPILPPYGYGDKVRIQGVIQEKEIASKQSHNSKQNDQVTKLLIIENPRISRLQQKSILIASASRVRSLVTVFFHQYLGSNEAALLLGIVFGIKEDMSQQLYTGFKVTGVLHVIAASGENVSIVSGFLLALFGHFLRRRYAIILTMLAICYYALLAGLDPSIVRASLMGLFAFGALLFGRQYYGFFSLIIVAWIMLMINPLQIEDVGFLLSFSSTIGIITLYPLLSKLRLFQLPLLDDASTTIAAQIASLPVMLYFFSSYSLISIMVNFLVLWTVPILMMLGGVAALLIFMPFVSQALLYLTYPLLLYFEKVTLFFGQFPFRLDLASLPTPFIIGYYCLLTSIVLKLRRYEK